MSEYRRHDRWRLRAMQKVDAGLWARVDESQSLSQSHQAQDGDDGKRPPSLPASLLLFNLSWTAPLRFGDFEKWLRGRWPSVCACHLVEKSHAIWISFNSTSEACAAFAEFNARPCPVLDGEDRVLFADWINVQGLVDVETATATPIIGSITDVPGLHVYPEFMNVVDRARFDAWLSELDGRVGGWERVKDREVLHFGHRYDYTGFCLRPLEGMPIPEWIQAMYAERIHPLVVEATKGSNGDGDNGNDSNDSGNDNSSNNEPLPYMNQLTVQRYPAGAGIPAHIDALDTIGPYVVGLSLGSGVTMDFERRRRKVESSTSACDENAVQKDKINTSPTVASPPPPPVKGRPSHIEILHHVPVHLTVGSLLVMAKDARYQWHHAIRERKTDVVGGKIVRRGVRVSLTFRAAVCATATGSLDVRR